MLRYNRICKYVMVANAGLATGLQQEQLLELSLPYGQIDGVLMLPGKSYSFIVFKDETCASKAYAAIHGKMKLNSTDSGPLYLAFTEKVPEINHSWNYDHKPPGLILLEHFVTEEEENSLLNSIDWNTTDSHLGQSLKHRKVKHYGYEFRYDTNNVDKDNPLSEGIPSECNFLLERLSARNCNILSSFPNQLTVNHYQPGQELLIELVNKYKEIIECKKTDGLKIKEKDETWDKLRDEYNSNGSVTSRTTKQLRQFYVNLKRSAKKARSDERVERYKTGGGQCTTKVDESVLSLIEDQIEPNSNPFDCDSEYYGIPPHVDTHSAFEDPILSLSLGSPIVMEFRHKDGRTLPVLLPQRSLLVMSEEARYAWSHSITPRKMDIVPTPNGSLTIQHRGERVSFTFRCIRKGECNCIYHERCDSYQRNCSNIQIKNDALAERLESLHVHEVYEEIASHFSDTRHKPWPNVLSFVESLPLGSMLVDVGCGNGKYFGFTRGIFEEHNWQVCDDFKVLTMLLGQQSAFTKFPCILCLRDVRARIDHWTMKDWPPRQNLEVSCKNVVRQNHIGCDRSLGLVKVCQDRGFEVFNCNCLSLPLRSNIADGCMSIAVIHHLATEERRVRAVEEMVRILRPGGRALIYVWAKDQERHKTQSSYLRQDRKNRRECDEQKHPVIQDNTNTNVISKDFPSLPVHTNRTQFQYQDLLVPWKLKPEQKSEVESRTKESSCEEVPTFYRYYHVFEEGELEQLCQSVEGACVSRSYYDQGNWCVILEKQ
ncbi:hypothetical protein ANN_21098 [Periplaneta americana]|uniref:tRNA (carboxymethyluridine(34)-5-O)-methyltransferase n=1 Tax=Periplaneta americana TaxID=6978 RepID=A0ABQ8SEF6_PERAM|nr:hypothetical protein ANN_21098 [Periplaneta americana]